MTTQFHHSYGSLDALKALIAAKIPAIFSQQSQIELQYKGRNLADCLHLIKPLSTIHAQSKIMSLPGGMLSSKTDIGKCLID